jgi:hypothetical protein
MGFWPLAGDTLISDDGFEPTRRRITVTGEPSIEAKPSPSKGNGPYVAAVLINLGLLFVVNNLLAWNVPSFLTEDFTQVLWLIDISLLTTVVVNLVYLIYDPAWFKSVCQIGLNVISLSVIALMFLVFPFDFSSSQFDWAPVTRVVLILTMVGTIAGMVVELVKLAGVWIQTTSRATMAGTTGGRQ